MSSLTSKAKALMRKVKGNFEKDRKKLIKELKK